MKSVLFLLMLLSFLNISCDRNSSNPVNKNGDSIIGDDFKDDEMVFPDGKPLFLATLKLKLPALLAKVEMKENGTYEISDELAKAIEKEQQDIIEELKNISEDIRIVYKYKRVLNAIAVEAPQAFADQINQLDVEFIEADERFARPQVFKSEKFSRDQASTNLAKINSMNFIGVDKVHALEIEDGDGNKVPVKGQGIKIGIIDSGIDYTHSMLGGPGDPAVFQSINPNEESQYFPNKKVVGGYDFVGATFSPGSHIFVNRIPKPDINPIDQGGHGTHVAGTAGGMGDGVNTYDGAAPEADLFALKVFGDQGGGTSDSVVIAALEYAADPNNDLKLNDKLDVVNLSLGGAFGKPHNLYGEAIKNITNAGVVVVAAAGNAGAVSNIVGAPSTSDDAISVAASIDNMEHNWKFPAVAFSSENNPSTLTEAVEGANTAPIEALGNITGPMFYIGEAAQDLTQEQKDLLKGKVALIDRGSVAFDDKITRAQDAGAIGVVMVNNQPGAPIVMGGEKTFSIPGVMIPLELGKMIKAEVAKTETVVQFGPAEKIEKPELIDTLTGFSSQGPRDLDGFIKPEISAPGEQIISALIQSGQQGVRFGGTSMASPHVAGVAALAKQYRKNLSAREIKALIVNSGQLISDTSNVNYPISRQGAGRIDAFNAVTSDLVFSNPTVSLGKISTATNTDRKMSVTVKNLGDQSAAYSLSVKNNPEIFVSLSTGLVSLDPGEEKTIELEIQVRVSDKSTIEADAFIQMSQGGEVVGNIPVLAIVNRETKMTFEQLSVKAASLEESPGVVAEATISNESPNNGEAYLFNLLGKDKRKPVQGDQFKSRACDLESSGYKILNKVDQKVLQIAVKLYNPVSGWGACDVNVYFDTNNDQKADKELYGTSVTSLPGFRPLPQFEGLGMKSVLFDSKKLEEILAAYFGELEKQPTERPGLNFVPALNGISNMTTFSHSTVAMVEVPLKDLETTSDGIHVNVVVSKNASSINVVEQDDSLSDDGEWKKVSLAAESGGYFEIPEKVEVPAGGRQVVAFKKGKNLNETLIAYFPQNKFTLELTGTDSQSTVKKPELSPIIVKP